MIFKGLVDPTYHKHFPVFSILGYFTLFIVIGDPLTGHFVCTYQ